jgi:hypothetical protein
MKNEDFFRIGWECKKPLLLEEEEERKGNRGSR